MNLPKGKTLRVASYADIFTIDEWRDNVDSGYIGRDDGTGYLGLDEATEVHPSNVWVTVMPPWATHVAWYNK